MNSKLKDENNIRDMILNILKDKKYDEYDDGFEIREKMESIDEVTYE